VHPPGELNAPREITVHFTQIQYTQTVFLNFKGLTWPHVSVNTLVPAHDIVIPPTSLGMSQSFALGGRTKFYPCRPEWAKISVLFT
jgi:hypothetical protein